MCAACPDTVTLMMPDGLPYTAGDVLTCSSNGYPAPTYEWTVNGVDSSTTSMQALQEGDHVYECTATVTFSGGMTCFQTGTAAVAAYSK